MNICHHFDCTNTVFLINAPKLHNDHHFHLLAAGFTWEESTDHALADGHYTVQTGLHLHNIIFGVDILLQGF